MASGGNLETGAPRLLVAKRSQALPPVCHRACKESQRETPNKVLPARRCGLPAVGDVHVVTTKCTKMGSDRSVPAPPRSQGEGNRQDVSTDSMCSRVAATHKSNAKGRSSTARAASRRRRRCTLRQGHQQLSRKAGPVATRDRSRLQQPAGTQGKEEKEKLFLAVFRWSEPTLEFFSKQWGCTCTSRPQVGRF